MNNNFKVIFKVNGIDDKSKNDFEQGFKELIINIKESLELEIDTLDRVILTDNYKDELESLKKEGIDESLLTYTDNGLGLGIGKSIIFNEKSIIILSETFLRMYLDKEESSSILNILAHELAHIDDNIKKNIHIKNFFVEEYLNYEDKIYYPLVKNSWNEFYANYKASPLLTSLNINLAHTTFFDSLNNFDVNIFDKKWDYQNGTIPLEIFLDSFQNHAYYLFNQACYLLGNILGINYTVDRYLDELNFSVKGTIMEETLYLMEKIFNILIKKYPNNWNGTQELEDLKNCLVNYYNDIGVVFEKDFTHINFSKYGHQNPLLN